MLCRACNESTQTRVRRSRARWRRIPDQLCVRCGALLGREEIELHARKKESQLEKFGLAGGRRVLKRRDNRA